MKLSELKSNLKKVKELVLNLPNGEKIPLHFHVTEIGEISKKFMDCGGKLRIENRISLQLWIASDTDHRLEANKLINIIYLAEQKLSLGDHQIEVEYQNKTINKFGIQFNGESFDLTSTQTACLAMEDCLVPENENSNNSCKPASGCC